MTTNRIYVFSDYRNGPPLSKEPICLCFMRMSANIICITERATGNTNEQKSELPTVIPSVGTL